VHIGGLTFGNEVKLLTLLGVLYIPTLARITYTTAISGGFVRTYVAARRLQGVSSLKIVWCPDVPAQLPCQPSSFRHVAACHWIVIEASVSFVGLGGNAAAKLGNMLADARIICFSVSVDVGVSGACISLKSVMHQPVGDGLRERVDPRTAPRH